MHNDMFCSACRIPPHTYLHTHTHSCTYTSMCTSYDIRTHAHAHACTQKGMRAHRHIRRRAHRQTHTCARTFASLCSPIASHARDPLVAVSGRARTSRASCGRRCPSSGHGASARRPAPQCRHLPRASYDNCFCDCFPGSGASEGRPASADPLDSLVETSETPRSLRELAGPERQRCPEPSSERPRGPGREVQEAPGSGLRDPRGPRAPGLRALGLERPPARPGSSAPPPEVNFVDSFGWDPSLAFDQAHPTPHASAHPRHAREQVHTGAFST